MEYAYNTSGSDTLNKLWTQSAVDCYMIGCMCSRCYLYKSIFSKSEVKCKMKDTVIELVRQKGVPKIQKNDI